MELSGAIFNMLVCFYYFYYFFIYLFLSIFIFINCLFIFILFYIVILFCWFHNVFCCPKSNTPLLFLFKLQINCILMTNHTLGFFNKNGFAMNEINFFNVCVNSGDDYYYFCELKNYVST